MNNAGGSLPFGMGSDQSRAGRALLPTRVFNAVPSSFFLGVCGTRTANLSPNDCSKNGKTVPIFSYLSPPYGFSSNILAARKSGFPRKTIREG
jgi:hypothetical protein